MDTDTFWLSLGGGVLIGLASAGLLWATGRVAGISGIVYGILNPQRGEGPWRLLFVCGLVVAGWVSAAIQPAWFAVEIDRTVAAVAVAGLLVGFGARLGGGCTSGHGVCGVGRFSWRSTVATVVFIVTGAVTVFVLQRAFGGAL